MNQLESIPDDFFIDNRDLELADFSGNNIAKSLPTDLFSKLEKLKDLDLSSNSLETVNGQ